jgi:ethanolamine utilization protein EutQ (cupin superfamily)
LGVSKGTIHAYIKGGKLSSKRKGGRTYVLDNEVQALKKRSEHWGWLLKKMRFFYEFIHPPFDALVHVVDGEVEITISGQVLYMKSGEMVIMPANEAHALKAMTPFKMILFMIQS